MEKKELVVEGMTCGHCKMAIERILRAEGIEEFSVDLPTGKVEINSSEEQFSHVVNEINETGIYKAKKA